MTFEYTQALCNDQMSLTEDVVSMADWQTEWAALQEERIKGWIQIGSPFTDVEKMVGRRRLAGGKTSNSALDIFILKCLFHSYLEVSFSC